MLLFHGSVIKFRQCEIKYMAAKKAYVKYKKKSVKKNQKKLEILFKIIHKRLVSRHAGSNEKISLG